MASSKSISCIRVLISKQGLNSQKEDIIAGITQGRSSSTRDLTQQEANDLIRELKRQEPLNNKSEKMRRKIISMAHEMGWRVPGTAKADMKAIDAWCMKFGHGKKKLNQYKYDELPMLVSQFEMMYKQFLNGI